MRNSPGFTLIEMVVTIGVLVTTITASFAVFLRFKSDQDVNVASVDLKNIVYEAKSNTLSATGYQKYCNASESYTFIGYQVVIRTSSSPTSPNNAYWLQILCKRVDPVTGAVTYPFTNIKSKSFPSSVTSSAKNINDLDLLETATILFSYPDAVLDDAATVDGYIVTLKSSSGKEINVAVDKGGAIQSFQ